jgi:hypothetical protein
MQMELDYTNGRAEAGSGAKYAKEANRSSCYHEISKDTKDLVRNNVPICVGGCSMDGAGFRETASGGEGFLFMIAGSYLSWT